MSFHNAKGRCQIGFSLNYNEEGSLGSNGQCWHTMFRNPVVVTGYPIPRRAREGTGLELPLNIMAGLVQSTRINDFMGKSYVKGFSSMLVAVNHVDGVFVWHHHYKPDGSRISYLEADGTTLRSVPFQDLASARHVVGWCNKASYQAGEFC